ncbi:MAG TPA: hypothetical protein VEJ63_03095 [Planctomycetota bacterium]|nr:hypothetical protein [Planctomycetota bacterium]
MRIVYCEGCSRRLTTDDVADHLHASADHPSYCQNCRPQPLEPILNAELVQRTINEARAKSASGLRKAVSRKRPGSGAYKAVRNARGIRALRHKSLWIACFAAIVGLLS